MPLRTKSYAFCCFTYIYIYKTRSGKGVEEEVSVSECVTVTAQLEERGESFTKVAHDFMTVTYLHWSDLNGFGQKSTKFFIAQLLKKDFLL